MRQVAEVNRGTESVLLEQFTELLAELLRNLWLSALTGRKWSRFSFCWVTSPSRRRSETWGASIFSGTRLTITSPWSRMRLRERRLNGTYSLADFPRVISQSRVWGQLRIGRPIREVLLVISNSDAGLLGAKRFLPDLIVQP